MAKEVKILHETTELIWNAKWRLVESKKDDGVQFVGWEYCGVPTNGVWMGAKIFPQELLTMDKKS